MEMRRGQRTEMDDQDQRDDSGSEAARTCTRPSTGTQQWLFVLFIVTLH